MQFVFSRWMLGVALGVLVVASVVVNYVYFSGSGRKYEPIRAVDREVTITCGECGHVQKDQLPAVQGRLLRGYPAYDFRVKCEKCGAAAKVAGVSDQVSSTVSSGGASSRPMNEE